MYKPSDLLYETNDLRIRKLRDPYTNQAEAIKIRKEIREMDSKYLYKVQIEKYWGK